MYSPLTFAVSFFLLIPSLVMSQPVVPSNGTVFSVSLKIPSLASAACIPSPRDLIDPLKAARMSHWRCRYQNGSLAEASRRDYLGTYRPMTPPPDAAPTNGYLFFYAPLTSELPTRILTPEGITYFLQYSPSRFLTEIVCSNTYRERQFPYSRIVIARKNNGAVARMSYWDGEIPSLNRAGVHAKSFTYSTNGFLKEVRYLDSSSNTCNDCDGFGIKSYRRGRNGEWLTISYQDKDGRATTDWHGVSRYEIAYNDALRFKSTSLFGPDGEPVVNALGGHTLIWQYDTLYNLIGTLALDAEGDTVFDGIPLMPELFYRTVPEALITREQRELAMPIWQFLDYSELVSALQRWHDHKTASRGVNQLQLEQLRVLADYLVFSRSGITAITAALLCRANGLEDTRWIKRAILLSGCVPSPESPAAQVLLDELSDAMRSNALLITVQDSSRLLFEYNSYSGALAGTSIMIPFDNIGDSVYLDALSAIVPEQNSNWLPSATDVRTALTEYARYLSRQGSLNDLSRMFLIEKNRIALRGKENVTEIKKILIEKLLLNLTNRVLYAEALPGDTAFFSRMIPSGPLFRLYQPDLPVNTEECLPAIHAYWLALQTRLQKLPDSNDTIECRRYFSHAAVDQAEWLYFHQYTNAALALYATARDICKQAVEPYLYLTEKLITQENLTAADRVLAELHHVDPDNARGRELSRLSRESRLRLKKIAQYEASITSANTACSSNVMTLADLYAEQNRPAKAALLVDSMFSQCTNCVETMNWLASFYARNGMLEESAACIAHLTRIEPDSFDHWSSRAAIAYERNRPDEGLAYITRASEIDRTRLRRMLTNGDFLLDLLKDGNTNLVRQLEELIK